ncbi:MAG: low molecular weight phosphatase family protein [Candidatus Methanospirare jalkutatii]|nr:low molecular weight phosphatase family protein [Candidatus Methanospirare jalkutatii]
MRREEQAKSEEKESQNDAGREKAESAERAGKVKGAEEGGGIPRILFVCVGNACRSPMAAGLARKMLNAEAESAGIAPFGTCATKEALEVMRKFGVDISSHKPKHVTEVPLQNFDLIVALDSFVGECLRLYYDVPAEKLVIWDIDDPFMKGLGAYERCAREIYAHIQKLSEDLKKRVKIEGEISEGGRKK